MSSDSKLPTMQRLLGPCVLLLFTLAVFSDILFAGEGWVLSRYGFDVAKQYAYLRSFTFEELSNGNLPLWNPHLFSGTPCLGSFQAALFYPPNWLYVFLPLDRAINIGIVLHVYLLGLFMYCWALFRGLRPVAAMLSAVLVMFCGPHFAHVYGGHLSNLCAMAWIPLLFLIADGLLRSGGWGWILLGIPVVAMQILAGHPQYVFYTIVILSTYLFLQVLRRRARIGVLGSIIGAYVGGAAVAAAQLGAGWAAAVENVRSSGVTWNMARMFSLPPESVITLLAPGFFLSELFSPRGALCWGRCNFPEVTLFMGVCGAVLAMYGAWRGPRRSRRSLAIMTGLAFILALGCHTPLFGLLYDWLPGFNHFRGAAKFAFFIGLFAAMLAGAGLQGLLRGRPRTRRWAAGVAIAGLMVLMLAVTIRVSSVSSNPQAWWGRCVRAIPEAWDSYLFEPLYADGGFVREVGRLAAIRLGVAGVTLLLISGLLALTRSSRRWTLAICILAATEVCIFARGSMATFPLQLLGSRRIEQQSADHAGDHRVLNIVSPNSGMWTGALDVWGDDPGVSARYAEFMAFTLGEDPSEARQHYEFSHSHTLWAIVRARYIYFQQEDPVGGTSPIQCQELPGRLPRLNLMTDYRVVEGRGAILAAMADSEFKPERTVILESRPNPVPVPVTAPGVATVMDESTDRMIIEADLAQPAILLVTDGYARGWCARALQGSVQQRYEVMPANYVLRAVPLAAGHHRLEMAYRPATFVIGVWISVVSLSVYILAGVLWLTQRRRRTH